MKQKLTIGLLLGFLIIVLGAIGLGGCSKDDDAYQGYIEEIVDSGYFHIRITSAPYNMPGESPCEKEKIGVKLSDFPDIDFKVGQKIDFRILSANGAGYPTYGTSYDYVLWYCEITILKIK